MNNLKLGILISKRLCELGEELRETEGPHPYEAGLYSELEHIQSLLKNSTKNDKFCDGQLQALYLIMEYAKRD